MPQRDLTVLARDLARIHNAVMTGSAPHSKPRDIVARSWSRMIKLGIDPSGANHRTVSSATETEERRQRSKLRFVVNELRDVLLDHAIECSFLLVVTDAQGVILWRDGAVKTRRQADVLGFVEGAHWAEDKVGTNAIGTALAEEAAVRLFSAEHFETTQHPWFCSAAPLHDPATGELLGVVDISGPALTYHPSTHSLVNTAVKLAESRLMLHRAEQLNRLRQSMTTALQGTTGPALVVDDDGWVALHQGVQSRDRIAVPRAERTIHVPGAGLCMPEKIEGGWLIRPTREHNISLVLLLSPAGSHLEVTSGAENMIVPLTPRHAQILAALTTAGPAGLAAQELSKAVYGDTKRHVTVRAEVSRLKRLIGALLTGSPYRWAPGVQVKMAQLA